MAKAFFIQRGKIKNIVNTRRHACDPPSFEFCINGLPVKISSVTSIFFTTQDFEGCSAEVVFDINGNNLVARNIRTI